MSGTVVNLEEQKNIESVGEANAPKFGDYQKPKQRGAFAKFLKWLGILLAVVLVIGSIAGFFYWQHLKTTPQYSLALLIDAARRDDQKTVDQLVDADAIVDDFMPQITDKAVELYGRGVPPATIAKMTQVAAPLLPSIKLRARAEIPTLIRDKTEKFNKIPFWAIALGAKKYLEIKQQGDQAFITSKVPDSPLNLTLKRDGDKWKVVGVKDEELSRQIAEKIGQEILFAASRGGIQNAGGELNVRDLGELINELNGIFK